MDNLTSIFREKKLKLTPQRIAVYKYLQSTKEHPSAETIYKALQANYPTMSLATVYKALKTLVEVNLIQEINVGEGNFRYDGNVCPHSHIQCLSCGKVNDVEGVCFANLNDQIKNCVDYEVLSNQVYFYGICKDCCEKNSEQH
ncbi:Fur family transcriptional regulator [Clostridium sp. WILCCON 0269]|uniref:Fur family transcriptional regulator n=1 Tax=Candidatus Clostridium eludens TaxID=3381663 RepID=A0ABW8SEX5_9CLOT